MAKRLIRTCRSCGQRWEAPLRDMNSGGRLGAMSDAADRMKASSERGSSWGASMTVGGRRRAEVHKQRAQRVTQDLEMRQRLRRCPSCGTGQYEEAIVRA